MIPNVFYFIYGLSEDFGGRPFSFAHYLAIESARKINKPDKIFFICEFEPQNDWFEKLKKDIEIVKIVAPKEIFGNPLLNYAHKSDIVRLEFLINYGGVYLDIDTICSKSINKLLVSSDFVLGAELMPITSIKERLKRAAFGLDLYPWQNLAITGLCNAVIMANKDSDFLKEWYSSYQSFNGHSLYQNWNDHSVQLPWKMYNERKFSANIQSPYAFHYPLWNEEGLAMLFEKNLSFKHAYLHHLWESFSWDRYLSKITPESIHKDNNTYSRLARKIHST